MKQWKWNSFGRRVIRKRNWVGIQKITREITSHWSVGRTYDCVVPFQSGELRYAIQYTFYYTPSMLNNNIKANIKKTVLWSLLINICNAFWPIGHACWQITCFADATLLFHFLLSSLVIRERTKPIFAKFSESVGCGRAWLSVYSFCDLSCDVAMTTNFRGKIGETGQPTFFIHRAGIPKRIRISERWWARALTAEVIQLQWIEIWWDLVQ